MSAALAALWRSGSRGAVIVCLAAACALTIVTVSILQAGVDTGQRPVRLASADIVVGGADSVVVAGEDGTERVTLPGPARLQPATIEKVRSWAAGHGWEVIEDYVSTAWSAQGSGHTLTMHAWSATRLGHSQLEGSAPEDGQVVVDATLADQWDVGIGDSVRLRTSAGVQTYAVSGIQTTPTVAHDRPAAYVTDVTAADLAGSPAPTLAGIIGLAPDRDDDLEQAADDLRSELGDATVRVAIGADRAAIENPAADATRADLVSLGGSLLALVVLITVIVLGTTMAALLDTRRRDLALLRTLAVTPRQLIRASGGESVISAAIGIVFGVPAGLVATAVMDGLLRWAGVLTGGVELRATVATAVIGAAATLALAALLSWATVRRRAWASPSAVRNTTSESDYRTRPRTLVIGWLLTLLGGGLSLLPAFFGGIAAIAIAGGGGLLLAFGASLAGRPITAALIRTVAAIRRRARPRNATAWLSGVLVESTAVRLAATCAPLMLAMSLALVQVAVPATLASSAERGAADALRVDSAVTSPAGVNSDEATGVAIAHQQISAWTDFLGAPEDFEFTAIGTDAALSEALALPVIDGRWDGTGPAGGEAVVSQFMASSLGLRVGEPVNLVLGDGTQAHPTVVAVHGGGYGVADVVVSFDQIAAHRPAGALAPGTADAILGTAAPASDALLTAEPARELFGGAGPDQATAASALPLLVLFAYIAVSMASTLARSMAARRRDHHLLARLGVLRPHLEAAIRFEALVGAMVCVGVGTLVALLPVAMIAWGVTGSPVPGIPVWFALLIGIGLAGLVILATVLPGRRTLRR